MAIRTDLAIECREMFANEIAGVESLARDSDGITVTHVKITTEEGAEKIGKPKGKYVTIELDSTILENDTNTNEPPVIEEVPNDENLNTESNTGTQSE